MNAISIENVAKLTSSALVVTLNLSVWTGRKLDKQVSREIDSEKHTKVPAGNYHKNLFAGVKSLEAIGKKANEVRTWHYFQTQPWGDNGDRLLNAALFLEYKQDLEEHEHQFEILVNNFLVEYPNLISQAAFTLGDLFDRRDYPDVDELRSKFDFKYTFSPMPTSGDFRIDINQQGLEELQAMYDRALEEKAVKAKTDTLVKVSELLHRMSDRLEDTEDGKNKIFRNSLVDNILDMCGMLHHFNIDDDPKMVALKARLEALLKGVDAESLRESDALRKNVKASVDSIITDLL